MNIEKMQKHFYAFRELQKIAKQLHKQDENACNYGLTTRQEKIVEKLETKAQEIARTIGLKTYHQSDPRGGTLYLIDKTMNETNYSNGVYIY